MRNLPGIKITHKRSRFTLWVNRHKPSVRLMIVSLGLILIILIVPSHIKRYFWDGLVKQKFLAAMLLGFCILAISLILSAGQRLDSWIFLFLNVRGHRPLWLDHTMFWITQLGHAF
ncbi:MAG: hypothetical protein C0410_12345, partial [Anaerolinea sp.]|nr:hypothetical protein [Anaerolinea sp.]